MKRISAYFPSLNPKQKKTDEVPSSDDPSVSAVNTVSSDSDCDPKSSNSQSDVKRKFQHAWLNDNRFRSWLSFSNETGYMTCQLCTQTAKVNSFTSGCTNYRTSTLIRHQSSSDHTKSLLDIDLQTSFKEKVETLYDKKKNSIICAMRSVYWLSKEKVATLKYKSLLELQALQGCTDLENLYSGGNATYMSERAAEDFQDSISSVIENDLKNKLENCNVVSLMCDESDDISVKKKLVCCVRFIPKGNFEPETLFLDNIEIDKGDAETVYNALKSCAVDKKIDMSKVMFFGSDGASVMTGQKSGVSARLLDDQPLCVNIHCMAHKLALCTSQAADDVSYLKKYRETLTNIFYHFKHSSLRTANLKKIEDVLDDKQLKIKEIHSVRWFAFYNALEAVFHTWGSLVTYFEQEKQAEKGGVAKGLHTQLTQIEFISVTYLLMDIMPILTKLSLSFQKQSIDVALVQPLVKSTITQLEYLLENDGHYMQNLRSAISDNKLDIRNHIINFNKNKLTHVENIRKDFISGVIAQIKKRFPVDDMSVLSALAVLGLRGINFVADSNEHGQAEIDVLCTKYAPAYVDQNCVKMEWQLVKSLVIQQRYPTDNIYILWNILSKHHSDSLPNLLKLAELALIAPLQTADCERAFSTMNDIKSSDRNRLAADRLNKLMRIALHKEKIAEFNYDEAVKVWRQAKDRRAF